MSIHQFTIPLRRNRAENEKINALSRLKESPKRRVLSSEIQVKRRPFPTDVETPDDLKTEREKKAWNKGDQSIYLTFIRFKGLGYMLFQTITRKKLPCIGRQIDKFHTLPLHMRILAFALFTLYKIVMTIIFVKMFFSVGSNVSELVLIKKFLHLEPGSTSLSNYSQNTNGMVTMVELASPDGGIPDLKNMTNQANHQTIKKGNSTSDMILSLRILHILVSSENFRNDEIDLIKNHVQEVLIPTIQDSIHSISSQPFSSGVDIYLILGWKIQDRLKKKIKAALPSGINLHINDNLYASNDGGSATQTFDTMNPTFTNEYMGIIKKEIQNYDFFTVFDSTFLVKGDHISHYLEITKLLDNVMQEKSVLNNDVNGVLFPSNYTFNMKQMENLIPGYIPVELLVNNKLSLPAIIGNTFEVDPTICCNFTEHKKTTKSTPDSNNILMQKVPSFHGLLNLNPTEKKSSFQWILLDPKNSEYSTQTTNNSDTKETILTEKVTNTNNWWMATQKQLQTWLLRDDCFSSKKESSKSQTNNIRSYSFLGNPPGCNLQPFISLKPDHFSKHLILQRSNKFQIELPKEEQKGIFMRTNTFYHEINEKLADAKLFVQRGVTKTEASKK